LRKFYRENIKASSTDNLDYCEFKVYEQYFEEKCPKLLDQMKKDKCKWLQNPSQTNGDNFNRARREANETFTNKTREYLKEKNEPVTKGKKKNIRDLYGGKYKFKKY
jgi:hypothetical protein